MLQSGELVLLKKRPLSTTFLYRSMYFAAFVVLGKMYVLQKASLSVKSWRSGTMFLRNDRPKS